MSYVIIIKKSIPEHEHEHEHELVNTDTGTEMGTDTDIVHVMSKAWCPCPFMPTCGVYLMSMSLFMFMFMFMRELYHAFFNGFLWQRIIFNDYFLPEKSTENLKSYFCFRRTTFSASNQCFGSASVLCGSGSNLKTKCGSGLGTCIKI
jgi:hypothetical protein